MIRMLKILAYLIVLAGLFILLGFINHKHENNACRSLSVEVVTQSSDELVNKSEVEAKTYAILDSINGRAVSTIDTKRIEEVLEDNPYIKSIDVFIDINGELKIRVLQREPIAKIIDQDNNSYYLDIEGDIFKNKDLRASRVIVANGNISPINFPENKDYIPIDSIDHTIIRELDFIIRKIRSNGFLTAQIDQVYVTGQNEYELIPKLGKHLVEMGDISSIDEKLENLHVFYTEGMANKDWNKYKKINLKYRNQIVCTKK